MDAGSRNGAVAARLAARPVPWFGATFVWMLMMVTETANGFVREILVAPLIGAQRARNAGLLFGSLAVLLIAWATARGLAADTRRAQLLVGAYWVTLTVTFELALGRAMDLSWARILSDYDPTQGGLMLLGLALMFVAPLLTARKPA